MSAAILDLTPRLHPRDTGIEVREETGWTCVLCAPGVSTADVQQALLRSGLVLTSDEVSGVAAIRRSATPPRDAA